MPGYWLGWIAAAEGRPESGAAVRVGSPPRTRAGTAPAGADAALCLDEDSVPRRGGGELVDHRLADDCGQAVASGDGLRASRVAAQLLLDLPWRADRQGQRRTECDALRLRVEQDSVAQVSRPGERVGGAPAGATDQG